MVRTRLGPADGAGEGAAASPAEVLAPAHTDWLYHYLRVTGDPPDVAAFR